ncbi:MAG: YfhO family protein [Candidatus Levybacteria bacterium]|nr:YfhO family protein [Candidatus Levybacteria bacterium]
MKFKEIIPSFFLLFLISALFFYKIFLQGLVPFPGELLASEYNPWRAYSFLGYAAGGIPSKVQYFDVIRQLYPWKTLSIDILKMGQIPFWNPYNFSGSPLMANFQSAVFYPFNFLYFLPADRQGFFSQINAWTILVFLQVLLAGFFTYLFSREIGIGKKGALLSSISFSLSLFMSVFLEYNIIGQTILWLPLSLYFIEKLLKKITFWRIIGFVFSLVFSFFAGHIQIFGFSLFFIFLYVVFRLNSQKNWAIRTKVFYFTEFLILFFLSFIIFAVQLLPTLELIKNSARVSQDYQFLIKNLLLQPSQLILFLSPDFFGNPVARNYLLSDSYPGNAVYIGLIPFIFSFFALKLFKINYFVKFLTLFSVFFLLFFIRSPITEIFYKINIPFFSTGSPNNAIFLLSFSLSILSGFGLEFWLKNKSVLFNKVLMFFGFVFVLGWLLIFVFHFQVSTKNFIYSTILFFVSTSVFLTGSIFKNKKGIISILFILITVFDLFYFFGKFNPFVNKELVFPKTGIFSYLGKNAGINRFWGYGKASIESNFSTQYSLYSPDGYDPLYPKRYGEFIQSSKYGKIETEFNNQNRSDAVIAPGFGEEDLAKNIYRLKVLDILGVKYILDRNDNASSEKTFPIQRFNLIFQENGWRVFENKKAVPRIFLTSDYKVFKNNQDFEKIFFAKDFDPSKTILLEENPSFSRLNVLKHLNAINIDLYSPNEIKLSVNSETDQLLFISDTYYPGWQAAVDGKETKIYRADYAFRAIIVPKGNHKILFEYKPKSFYLGLKITIVGIISLFLCAIFARRLKLNGE